MDSMYGGRPGAPFVIKASFASIKDMETEFSKGANYQDVWYGEYCIIDTPNKNDRDNGKIFMRGPDFTKEDGGANYVGQIVGPQSGTPHFQIAKWQEVIDQTTRQLDVANFENRTYPTSDGIYFDSSNTNSDKPVRQDLNFAGGSGDLLPGKYVEGGTAKYRDNIKYVWCNVAKPTREEFPTLTYIGFQVPYSVFEFDAEAVSPYDSNGNYNPTSQIQTVTENAISKNHPFYWSYHIKIPNGVKGDTVRDLRVEKISKVSGNLRYVKSRVSGDALVYNYKDFPQNASTTALGTPTGSTYTCPAPTADQERSIWVFDLYLYDQKKTPTPYTVYVGDYNIVKDVNLSEDGTLTFKFTMNDKTVFPQAIKWITSTSLNTSTGHFEMGFNHGPSFTSDLRWVKDIQVRDDGTVFYDFTCGDDRTASKLIKWIEAVTLNESNGHFTVTFNNDKSGSKTYENDLTWVKDVAIDKTNGSVTVNRTTGSTSYPDLIRWVNSVSLSPAGEFKVDFNNGSDYSTSLKWVNGVTYNRDNGVVTATYSNGATPYTSTIDMITSMSMSVEGKLSYKTNTGKTIQVTGDNINYIVDVTIDPNDYHLLVLFNDPSHRITLSDANAAGIGSKNEVVVNGVRWVRNVKLISGIVTEANKSSMFWKDFGAVKDQSGVLIGTNVTGSDINPVDPDSVDRQDVIDYLGSLYPNGYTGGKVVTYCETEDGAKAFYAFDYDTKVWYYLGEVSDIYNLSARIVSSADSPSSYENVLTGGVVFLTDKITYQSAASSWYPWL